MRPPELADRAFRRTQTYLRGERAVGRILRSNILQVVKTHHQCPFDFVANGYRVEVKTCANKSASGSWTFTIQRNGVLDESRVDVYILRLENFPVGNRLRSVHLIVPAPLNKLSVSVRPGTFAKNWARYWGALDPLGKPGEFLWGEGQ